MYAVLYSDAATLERLIGLGADPNKRNDAGATALMWAALDLAKARVLLEHGADVNAKSDDMRTALMVAAGRPGGAPVVKLLLERGAWPTDEMPLLDASIAGDFDSMRTLLEHGAEVKKIAVSAIINAAAADCVKCIDLLVARNLDAKQYTIAMHYLLALDNPKLTRLMLDHGADVNAVDRTGWTALMYAVTSDLLPVEQVKMLIEKGANVNSKSQHQSSADTGRTALDLARFHGDTAVVDLLLKSGATSGVSAVPIQPAPMRSGNTIKTAVALSLPLLQRADANFTPKTGCFSCHNQSLTAMAVALARKNGLPVDERLSAQQVRANVGLLESARDRLRQGTFDTGINASPWVLRMFCWGSTRKVTSPTSTLTPLPCTYARSRWLTGTGLPYLIRDLRSARRLLRRQSFLCAACNCTPPKSTRLITRAPSGWPPIGYKKARSRGPITTSAGACSVWHGQARVKTQSCKRGANFWRRSIPTAAGPISRRCRAARSRPAWR